MRQFRWVLVVLFFPCMFSVADESVFYSRIGSGLGLVANSDASGDQVNGEFSYAASMAIEGAAGWASGDYPFRGEVAIAYQSNGFDQFESSTPFGTAQPDGGVRMLSFLGNGYYGVPIPSMPKLRPYLMFGLGFSNVKLEIEEDEVSSMVFTTNYSLGMEYVFAPQIIFDLRYKYMLSGAPDGIVDRFNNETTIDGLRVNQFLLGIQYRF